MHGQEGFGNRHHMTDRYYDSLRASHWTPYPPHRNDFEGRQSSSGGGNRETFALDGSRQSWYGRGQEHQYGHQQSSQRPWYGSSDWQQPHRSTTSSETPPQGPGTQWYAPFRMPIVAPPSGPWNIWQPGTFASYGNQALTQYGNTATASLQTQQAPVVPGAFLNHGRSLFIPPVNEQEPSDPRVHSFSNGNARGWHGKYQKLPKEPPIARTNEGQDVQQAAQPRRPKQKSRWDQKSKAMQRPEPTTEYLRIAAQEPRPLSASRPLLVVLDLNGTLLHRFKNGGSNKFVPRPKLDLFLEYLFRNHTVMVWSSAQPRNVTKMCTDLFTPEQYGRVIAFWTRDHCRLPDHLYAQKVQVYKQLSWVWSDPGLLQSGGGGGGGSSHIWNQANTVLIDDSVEKAASEPHNIIAIDTFEGGPEQTQNTDVLGQMVQYLDALRAHDNVSAYMRSRPFVHVPGEGEPEKKSRRRRADGEEMTSGTDIPMGMMVRNARMGDLIRRQPQT